jgi:hypothetical protein
MCVRARGEVERWRRISPVEQWRCSVVSLPTQIFELKKEEGRRWSEWVGAVGTAQPALRQARHGQSGHRPSPPMYGVHAMDIGWDEVGARAAQRGPWPSIGS